MRLACLPVLLPTLAALAWSAESSSALPRSLPTVRIEGREYLSLSDWAKANDSEFRWLKRDETCQLSHNASKLRLDLDSREADFNGLQVWLSFPFAQRNGIPYLSRLDTESTLRPLLYSLRGRPSPKIPNICLDAGHGGKDPGNCVGSNQEKKYNLLLAQELRQQLQGAGFKVTLTRSSDKFIDLPYRPELAKKKKADLFLSLHFNAIENSQSTVQGAQVFCLTPPGAASTNSRGEPGEAGWCPGNQYNQQSLWLAYLVQKALTQDLGAQDRGIRRARFAVLRDAAMPAVLIEAGFMSHPVEGRKIFSAAYRRQLAQAIVKGVKSYEAILTSGPH